MGLLDLVNQLVAEHGSSVIQEKFIALLKYEAASLEKHKAAIGAENVVLRKENESLKANNILLQKENAELKVKLQSHKQASHDNILKSSIMKWGCITFPPDPKLYCPSCFHKTGKKIETSRVDTHSRFCSACKTNIPSG